MTVKINIRCFRLASEMNGAYIHSAPCDGKNKYPMFDNSKYDAGGDVKHFFLTWPNTKREREREKENERWGEKRLKKD